MNGNNKNNIRYEAGEHFRKKNKTKEYLTNKIHELEVSNSTKDIRDLYKGVTEYKMDHQARTDGFVLDFRVDSEEYYLLGYNAV
jgi:hypothetical protein